MGKLIFKGIERSKTARDLFNRSKIETNNSVLIDMCCYDLQQALEFMLKGIIEINGNDYNKSHDLRAHIQELYKLEDELLNNILNEISLRAATFNEWQTKSRYMDMFFALEGDIEKGLEICRNLVKYIQKEYFTDD